MSSINNNKGAGNGVGGGLPNTNSPRPALPPLSLLNNSLLRNHSSHHHHKNANNQSPLLPPKLDANSNSSNSLNSNSATPVITNSRMTKDNNESQNNNDHSTPDSSVSSRSPSEYLEVNLLDKDKNASDKSDDSSDKTSDKASGKTSDESKSNEPLMKKHQPYAILPNNDKDNFLPKPMNLNNKPPPPAPDAAAGSAAGSATGSTSDPSPNSPPPTQEGGKKLAKRFFCKTCNQAFTRKHNMVSHELIHTSLKPHICSVCNTKFRRIHDLKRHEKLHTGAKPYHCDKCGRSFARPDALTRHQSSPNACLGNKPNPRNNNPNNNADSAGNNQVVSTSPPEEQKGSIPGSTDITSNDSSNYHKSHGSLATTLTQPLSPHINDTIKRENYDINRLKAFRYQIQLRKEQEDDTRFSDSNNDTQSPPPQRIRYPYNTTTTITTTTTTTTNRNRNGNGNDPHAQNNPPRGRVDASPMTEPDRDQNGPVYGSRVGNEYRPSESHHSGSHESQSGASLVRSNDEGSPNNQANPPSAQYHFKHAANPQSGLAPPIPSPRAEQNMLQAQQDRPYPSEGVFNRNGAVYEGGQQRLPQPATFYERSNESRSASHFRSPNSGNTSTYKAPNTQAPNQNHYGSFPHNAPPYPPNQQPYPGPSNQNQPTPESRSQPYSDSRSQPYSDSRSQPYSDSRNQRQQQYPNARNQYPDGNQYHGDHNFSEGNQYQQEGQNLQRHFQQFQFDQFQQRQQFEQHQYDEKQRFMKNQEMAKNYAGYGSQQPGSKFNENFVPMASYQDLVKYTQELQANMSKMNNRLKILEDTGSLEKPK